MLSLSPEFFELLPKEFLHPCSPFLCMVFLATVVIFFGERVWTHLLYIKRELVREYRRHKQFEQSHKERMALSAHKEIVPNAEELRKLKTKLVTFPKAAETTSTKKRTASKKRNQLAVKRVASRVKRTKVPRFTPVNNIQYVLSLANVNTLYFYAYKSQLPFIQEHGIYSPDYLKKHHYHQIQEDTLNFKKFVHLYFCSSHPKIYHLRQKEAMIRLDINLSVLDDDTFFFDKNSLCEDAKCEQGLKGLELINIPSTRYIKVHRSNENFTPNQAEVLIRGPIPPQAIININQPKEL